MRLFMILFLDVLFTYVKGQATQPPNYSCNQNNNNVEFTLSLSSNSAWEPTLNCSLQECYSNSSNNSSCLLSPTPCYDYRTLNNSRFCAPGIICSILEACNNITYTCTSNTFICVVNSCCSPQAVCLPLSVTNFCISDNTTSIITTTTTTSITSTTTTTTTTSSNSTRTTSTRTTSSTSTTSKTSTSTSSTSKTSTTTSVSTTKTTTTTPTKTTTTTATTAETTTTYSCFASIPASLATLSGSTNTSWTHYAYTYTATETNPLLMFGVDAFSSMYIVLDDVSVVDTDNSSVQLLTNPSFDNSTSTPTGWSIWCTNSCSSNSGGTIISSGCLTNNCYKSECYGVGAHDYLVQTFSAVPGQNYTISFWFQRVRTTASGGTAILYVNII